LEDEEKEAVRKQIAVMAIIKDDLEQYDTHKNM